MNIVSFSIITGSAIALVHIASNVRVAFEISRGFAFSESLLPELITAAIVGAIFLLPAIVFTVTKPFTKTFSQLSLLYPLILGAGLYFAHFIATDPLEAGLPMVVIVMPALIILSILFATTGKLRD